MQEKTKRVHFFPYGAGGDISEVMPRNPSFPALPFSIIVYLSILPGHGESDQLTLGVKQECLLFRRVQRTDRLWGLPGKIVVAQLLSKQQ